MSIFPIDITEKAKEQAWDSLSSGQDLVLRVYVQGGGCSGFTYGFVAEREPQEDDLVQEIEIGQGHGFKVAVDPMSATLLAGATLDFEEELMSRQFVLRNPNAKATCGCGASFAI